MFEVDAITIRELKDRTGELNQAISKYEQELSTIRGNTSILSKIDDVVRKYCSSIQTVLSADVIDNAMLRKVINKIVVTVEGEIQVYIKLFSDLEMENAVAM